MNFKPLLNYIGIIGTGHILNFFINIWFDWLLYVPVINFFGPFWGCGVMIILSILLNLSLIKGYDCSKKDWFGFELIKEGKASLSSMLPWYLRWLLWLGDWGTFIALSVYDPLLATIYFRKKDQAFKGMTKRDWKIFAFSTLVGNVGWTGFIYGGLSAYQAILKTAHLF